MIRIPSAYWFAGLCAAWLLTGIVGHAPWKGPDSETFARLLAAREHADWLFPAAAAEAKPMSVLYLWLAQLSGKLLTPLLPLHDAARFASGVLVALSLWLTGLTARRLYDQSSSWTAVLALLGCIGLLVPAHEINAYTAQLAAIALLAYGLARMLAQPLIGGGLVGLGLTGLVLSGAWLVAVALAIALLLLPLLFPSWRTSARVGGSWFALTVGLALCAAWLLSVRGHTPERLLMWWQREAGQLVFAAGRDIKYNPLYFINTLTWFAWPAWPVAGWALYRLKREGWDNVRLWMPLGTFLVSLLALSLRTKSEETQAIVFLVPLALLASAGFPDLRRGAANALMWFSVMVFSFFALVFWVYWSAFDLGWPAQFAKRLSKLGMQSQGLRGWALSLGLLLTAAWIVWLAWLRRQPQSGQRPLLAWAAGMSFVWCLLMALFMKPLDNRLSFNRMAEQIRAQVGAASCVSTRHLNRSQRLLLEYHTGLSLQEGNNQCGWLLVYRKGRTEEAPGAEWIKRWQGARPGDRGERYWLYQKRA